MDVKTICLGVLTLGDASGYEIRKQFEDGPFAHFYDASYGSIYPAMSRLLEDGLVSVTRHAQDGKPDKKVYSLTAAGRQVFVAALGQLPGPDKIRSETLVQLFFADLMAADDLTRVFDGYLAHYRDKVSHMEALDPQGVPPGRQFVRGMGLTFYKAMTTYMEDNRDAVLADIQAHRAETETETETGTSTEAAQ